MNDHLPECEPPFQEVTVYTLLGQSMEVTKMSCHIPQEPQRLAFSYSIVRGGAVAQEAPMQGFGQRAPGQGQLRSLSVVILLSGNSQSQFNLQGAVLMHSGPCLGLPWPEQPQTYELLIRVADAGPSTPHLSTTATVIVHLLPWRASTVATSTHTTTVSGVWLGVGGREDATG